MRLIRRREAFSGRKKAAWVSRNLRKEMRVRSMEGIDEISCTGASPAFARGSGSTYLALLGSPSPCLAEATQGLGHPVTIPSRGTVWRSVAH